MDKSVQLKLEIEELREENKKYKTNNQKKMNIPHIIKYMGSKKPIIEFIIKNISEVHKDGNYVCDLFAGSCSVSAALRKEYDFISNDIQDYSRILAHTYFSDLSIIDSEELLDNIENSARIHVTKFKEKLNDHFIDYTQIEKIETYQSAERKQRELITAGEFEIDYHLFTKYYSGTYWSLEQCAWIDALRKTADTFYDSTVYYSILASIMYSMSYSAQSTGHFAQYRDGNTMKAVTDIILYRQKDVFTLFKKKLIELISELRTPVKKLITSTESFEVCLNKLPVNATVYADPPYAPVHYSRFYHALETLIKYDYPDLEHKGRYRTDRHQSDFSQKTKALEAFTALFEGIINRKCQLVLSYSSTGVLPITEIIKLANSKFPSNTYQVVVKTFDHKHSTMGRFEDRDRDVIEYLIMAKLI